MSPKRPASKQRRQSQNQRQRAALEARRANAAVRRDLGDLSTGSSRAAPGSPRPSLLARLRGASATGRAVRTGGSPTTTSGLPVGHRAAMAAVLAAAAAAVVGSLMIRLPVDRAGEPISTRGALAAEWSLSAFAEAEDDPTASAEEVAAAVSDWTPGGEEPYAQALWPLSLGVLLPVAGAGLAYRAVSKRAPAKVVNRTMYITLFGTLLAAQLLILFLPAVVGVAIAAFQVRKAEVAAQMAAVEDPAGGGPDDDVIEVEEATEDAAFLGAEDAADAEPGVGDDADEEDRDRDDEAR